jgi:group I intron endonuclease
MKSGIYRIRCVLNEKIYVGSAVNLMARWSVHRYLLSRGKHNSIHLQRAWDKNGFKAFEFEVLEHVEKSRLLEREQCYLDQLMPFGHRGYNISPTAGNTHGAKRTPEQIEKMAARFRGKQLSPEHRIKISAAGKGKRHSEQTKDLMRQKRLDNNSQRGRPLTDAQKKALFKSGDEHPWYARKHSEEAKRKISASKSAPILQVLPDADTKLWTTPRDAAKAIGLRSADSIYRALKDPQRTAAGYHWRRVTDRAIIS